MLLSNGKYSTMENLRFGDRVQVAPGLFEPVIMFTHASSSIQSEMVVIERSSGAKVVASPGHMIYLNGRVIEVAEFEVGDTIIVLHEDKMALEIVSSVTVEEMVGLYHPQTPSGNILVYNGQISNASAVLSTYIHLLYRLARRTLCCLFLVQY